jgi:hypothetical protein
MLAPVAKALITDYPDYADTAGLLHDGGWTRRGGVESTCRFSSPVDAYASGGIVLFGLRGRRR